MIGVIEFSDLVNGDRGPVEGLKAVVETIFPWFSELQICWLAEVWAKNDLDDEDCIVAAAMADLFGPDMQPVELNESQILKRVVQLEESSFDSLLHIASVLSPAGRA